MKAAIYLFEQDHIYIYGKANLHYPYYLGRVDIHKDNNGAEWAEIAGARYHVVPCEVDGETVADNAPIYRARERLEWR
jgi:hypothetical protein